MDAIRKEQIDLLVNGTKFNLMRDLYQKHLLSEEILACMFDVPTQGIWIKRSPSEDLDDYYDFEENEDIEGSLEKD